jgi:hypothetical protein
MEEVRSPFGAHFAREQSYPFDTEVGKTTVYTAEDKIVAALERSLLVTVGCPLIHLISAPKYPRIFASWGRVMQRAR